MLSVPLNALAQQSIGTAENLEAAEIDTLVGKVAAGRDANNDFNKLSWMGIGAGICVISTAAGLAGCAIGGAISAGGGDIGGWVGVAAATSLLIGTYSLPALPPSGRLIGKSPEYVESYTDAYKRKTRSLRLSSTVLGASISALPASMLLLGLWSEISSD